MLENMGFPESAMVSEACIVIGVSASAPKAGRILEGWTTEPKATWRGSTRHKS